MFREKKTHPIILGLLLLLGTEIYSQQVSFVTRREFNAGGTNPTFVTVYDVDGDKNLDVLVGTTGGLRLMRGDGAGRLSTGEPLTTNLINSVFAGDFNGDGITDLVVAKAVNSFFLVYGDGQGGFREPERVNFPTEARPTTPIQSVTGADFDGDNYIDLVITMSTNLRDQGSIILFRGRPQGGFDFDNPEPFWFEGQPLPRFVTVADLNGDGYPDLIISNQLASTVVTLLWNPAKDQFDLAATISLGASRLPNFIATGDFNNDGRVDIAVANMGTPPSLSIFLGDGRGGFDTQTARTIPTGVDPYVIAADFNGDGFLDLAVSNNNTNSISIFYGNGRGEFGAPRNFAVGMGPRVLAAGDFNGDDIMDLVVATSGSNTVTLLLGDGAGGFLTGEHSVGRGPSSIGVGDFNGDKRPDLAVTDRESSTITILLANDRGTFDAPRVIDSKRVGTNPSTIAVGDVDGDDNLDLIVSFYGLNYIKVFFGDGKGNFPRIRPILGLGLGITSMVVKDLNRDGKLDIAFTKAAVTPGVVSVLFGDGEGGFGNRRDFTVQNRPEFIIAEDFNGDNWPDLAVVNRDSNSVSLLLSDRAGSFMAARTTALGAGATQPTSMAAGDFNGDDTLDLAVTNIQTGNISIFLGDGQGNFDVGTPPRRITATTPTFTTVADFNGDGKLDIAVASRTLNSVTIFLGDGTGNFTMAAGFGLGPQGPVGFLTTADMLGSGKADLLATNFVANSVSVLINDSAP